MNHSLLQGIQKSQQMSKYYFPHPQLKLVKEINYQHTEQVKASRAKPFRKGVLFLMVNCQSLKRNYERLILNQSWN